MKNKTRLAIGDINALIKEYNDVKDTLARVQREKDLKVDTINKKYEARLEILMNKEKELEILLRDTKEYVKNVSAGTVWDSKEARLEMLMDKEKELEILLRNTKDYIKNVSAGTDVDDKEETVVTRKKI